MSWLLSTVGIVGLAASTYTASPLMAQTSEETPSVDDPAASVEELFSTDDTQSLFEVTDSAVSGLLEPLDLATETERALRGAGRLDPFKPVASGGGSPPSSELIDLPPIPGADPAPVAKSVRVTGIIRVGNDTYALMKGPSGLAEVIAEGGMYESVKVASISVSTGEVVLTEGGETVIARVE
ncbi:MAG: hypothetical protein AB4040_07805 [Synechococcus sp.]